MAGSGITRGMAAMLTEAAARIAAGETRVGWKIGVNGRDMQARLGLSGPTIGALTSRTLAGDHLPAFEQGVMLIEAEIALRLGEGCRIEAMAPALEMLCVTGPLDDAETLIARRGYHAGYAIGEWGAAQPALSAADIRLKLEIEGGPGRELDPALVTGSPAHVVQIARNLLVSAGEDLKAGDIIICGSLNTPARVLAGQWVSAEIAPVGSIRRRIGPGN